MHITQNAGDFESKVSAEGISMNTYQRNLIRATCALFALSSYIFFNVACDDPCAKDQKLCNTSCVDLKTNPDNCGACDNACANGEVCSEGQCKLSCASGTTQCDASCVDTNSDNANCGACGVACPSADACVAGVCMPSPKKSCEDLRLSDPSAPSGAYIIDVDGSGAELPFSVYCDMTTDAGGWTLVVNQVPSEPLPDLQTTVNIQNFGTTDKSYRLGNPTIAAIAPTVAWKLTDDANSVYFKPSCTVDWGIYYLNKPASDCTIGYTATTFAKTFNANFGAVAARGIGINYNGLFCSIRAYNVLAAGGFESGPAASCLYTKAEIVRLWFK